MEQFISGMRDINDGETIIKENTLALHAYVLLSGKAKVFKNFNEKQIYIGMLDEGDVFGEMCFFGLAKRGATVIADGKARVGLIAKKTFMGLIEELSEKSRAKLEKMSYDLFYLNDIYCRLTTCLHELYDVKDKLTDPTSLENEDMSYFMKKISSIMCRRFQNTFNKCSMAISLYEASEKSPEILTATLI